MNMNCVKISGKKILKGVAVVVAGTFILSGVALAANKQDKPRGENRDRRPAYHQQQANPEKIAPMVAKTFGISQEKITSYQAQGYTARDLFSAGLFARAAGKSYDEVIVLKTKDNTWKDIGEKLKLTKEQLTETRQDIFAERTAQMMKTDKGVVKSLMQQGYKAQDIVPAGVLSNRAGKSIGDVLSLKKINNNWQEIAASLGVSKEDFKNDMRKIFEETDFGAPNKKPGNFKRGFDKKGPKQ